MATDLAPGPLSGIRVLDLTNVLAGPFCCYHLALMGAEVIKVERPGSGDLARNLGADPARNAAGMGISFLAQNAGKASVTLDMKATKGKALLRELVKTADVLVENFRPGVMVRLGLGAAALHEVKPELIYAAISGFGQTGPRVGDPAYDQIVQGMSGVMAITGSEETAPTRVGYPLADTVGGMTAAFAIAAALNERPRGKVLDISMTEAVISTMGWVVSNHLVGGTPPAPQGNENPTSAPSGTFETADGPVNIAANRDEQWQALAAHLGREDLLKDPAYATREARKANRVALRAVLEETLRKRSAADWVAELNALGVPAGQIMGVAEALDDLECSGRDLIAAVDLDGEEIPLAGSPVVMDGVRPHPRSAPPKLGADAERIWAEIGLSGEDIAALREEGVI